MLSLLIGGKEQGRKGMKRRPPSHQKASERTLKYMTEIGHEEGN